MQNKKNLANIDILFDARNNAIKFIEDHSSVVLEAKRLAKQGTGLKILASEQILREINKQQSIIQETSNSNKHYFIIKSARSFMNICSHR